MHYDDAVEQLSLIHSQLAKGEVYRGYRPLAVASAGVCGLLAPLAQSAFVGEGDVRSLLLYWIVVGIVAGCLGGGITLYNFLFREDEFARRRTLCVVGQFLPCLFVGGVITAGLMRTGNENTLVFVPGLWVVLFSLGVFASRPYLPSEMTAVAGCYLLAGSVLLAWPGGPVQELAWKLGITFGIGQLATAFFIHRYQKSHQYDT